MMKSVKTCGALFLATTLSLGLSACSGRNQERDRSQQSDQAQNLKSQAQDVQKNTQELSQQAKELSQQAQSEISRQGADSSQSGTSSGADMATGQQSAQQSGQSYSWAQLKQNRQAVTKIQQSLKDKGYDPGKVDGMWGPETKSALQKFQNDQKISADANRIDSATLQALGVDMTSGSRAPASESK